MTSFKAGKTDARKKETLYFNIQELDRRRIARDLHDTSLQTLASLVHRLELASLYIDRDVVQAKLELALIGKSINSVIEEIRNTIFDLRPMLVDDLGLSEAVGQLMDKLKLSLDIAVSLHLEEIAIEDGAMRETVTLALFRIIQECVENVRKHSEAKKLGVTLKNKPDEILLTVTDDGVGFDLASSREKNRHFGLLIMEERVRLLGGEMNVKTAPGMGTKIQIQIPKQQA